MAGDGAGAHTTSARVLDVEVALAARKGAVKREEEEDWGRSWTDGCGGWF